MNAPADAVCIEDHCHEDATTTRPARDPWLTEGGVITEADEWVCAIHAADCDCISEAEGDTP